MTLAKAQEKLNFDGDSQGRKLRLYVEKREEELGVKVIIRQQNQHKTHYRITLSALKRYCPELFPSAVNDLQRDFRRYLDEIDERIATVADERISILVEPRLENLWNRDEIIARSIKDLAEKVRDLSLLEKDEEQSQDITENHEN